jgi:predicted nucleic acid-binding protein
LEGVLVSVEHIHAGRCNLVVSRAIPDQEVPKEGIPADRRRIYDAFFLRPNVVPVDYEVPIIELMRELLAHYRDSAAPLRLMDAMHLATAIRKKVDAFYTFDSGGKGGADLLSLDGNVAGHNLKICKPPFEQAPILFRPT